jgi:uncharacterized protein
MKHHPPLAVITGASRGIGAAYARALAQKGYDLLLVARNKECLGQVARELERTFDIVVVQEQMNLAESGSGRTLFNKAMALGRPVTLVIHNAGFGLYGRFTHMPPSQIADMIDLHMHHVTESTRLFLPPMMRQGKGAIINVASTAGFLPIPCMAEYAATKAYLIAFSEAVSWEVRSSGVTVQACCPGYTDTEFHAAAGHRPRHMWSSQSAEQVAETSLRALDSRKAVVTIGWQGRVAYWASRWLPRNVLMWSAQKVVKPPIPSN